MPSEGEPARRGRPRDTAVDQRVLDVACDLLLTGGYAGLNVDEVAERAAVAKTTLYRRWPTKDHLAVAVVTRTILPVAVPDTGDLYHDLTEYAAGLGRHTTLLARLRRATEREELRPDIDHAILIDQVSGPIYYRVLITGAAADQGYAARLVSAVLEGALAPAVKATPHPPA